MIKDLITAARRLVKAAFNEKFVDELELKASMDKLKEALDAIDAVDAFKNNAKLQLGEQVVTPLGQVGRIVQIDKEERRYGVLAPYYGLKVFNKEELTRESKSLDTKFKLKVVHLDPILGQNYVAGLWSRRDWEAALEDQNKDPSMEILNNLLARALIAFNANPPTAFNPNEKCSPTLTQCPRCNNPHNACDSNFGVDQPKQN